jgi:hypothetical protein
MYSASATEPSTRARAVALRARKGVVGGRRLIHMVHYSLNSKEMVKLVDLENTDTTSDVLKDGILYTTT